MMEPQEGDPLDPSDQQTPEMPEMPGNPDVGAKPARPSRDAQKRRTKQPKHYLLLTDSDQMNVDFYRAFDESFLYHKAMTLQWVIEHAEEFTPQLEQALAEWGSREPVSDKYLESLRAEQFFMALQQVEAFFALLIAPFQSAPDWVFLTDYKPDEIKDAIQHFYDERISPLTNDHVHDMKTFLIQAVYSGLTPHNENEEEMALWEESLKNIEWILGRAAGLYLKNPGAYNSYKHGLRMMTGETHFGLRLNDADGNSQGQGIGRSSKDSLIFLELDKSDRGTIVNETMMHFSAAEAFVCLRVMHLLLINIKVTRLAAYSKQPLTRLPLVLGKLDQNQLIQEWAGSNFRITMGPRIRA